MSTLRPLALVKLGTVVHLLMALKIAIGLKPLGAVFKGALRLAMCSAMVVD